MSDLEKLRLRDEELTEQVTQAFRATLEELLPRIHLHVVEHGPSLRLGVEVVLKMDGEQLAGAVDTFIENPPPRALSHFGINADTEQDS